MNLIKKLFRSKEISISCFGKRLKMLEERIIVVPNYNDKNCKDPKISMFH